MTEKQAAELKDLFFRIKQFYFGMSEKTASAASMTAGETVEYIAAVKAAEKTLFGGEADKSDILLPADAEITLLSVCTEIRLALGEKNIRLSGDLAALGIRLLGVYTFPYMGRARFVKKHLLPFREKHGEDFFVAWEADFLAGKNAIFRLRPVFSHSEGHYYEDDADEALSVAHPWLYRAFLLLGLLVLFGSVIGYGALVGALSLSSGWLVVGYLGAAALGAGLVSLTLAWVQQYLGHLPTLLLLCGGALCVLLSVVLAL